VAVTVGFPMHFPMWWYVQLGVFCCFLLWQLILFKYVTSSVRSEVWQVIALYLKGVRLSPMAAVVVMVGWGWLALSMWINIEKCTSMDVRLIGQVLAELYALPMSVAQTSRSLSSARKTRRYIPWSKTTPE